MTQEELEIIKSTTEVFLTAMTVVGGAVSVAPAADDSVMINLELAEPQFLIGQDGKTLLDLQRLIRMVLCKKLGKIFYVKIDINGYNAKKNEHMKKMANETADQVVLTGLAKTLPPMSSYDRRIIHAELANRQDVKTESHGEGEERSVKITVK